MFKLAAEAEKTIKLAFAKKSHTVLTQEIGDLEFTKLAALKNQPDLDVSELDYYIQLRKDAMK